MTTDTKATEDRLNEVINAIGKQNDFDRAVIVCLFEETEDGSVVSSFGMGINRDLEYAVNPDGLTGLFKDLIRCAFEQPELFVQTMKLAGTVTNLFVPEQAPPYPTTKGKPEASIVVNITDDTCSVEVFGDELPGNLGGSIQVCAGFIAWACKMVLQQSSEAEARAFAECTRALHFTAKKSVH